MISARDLNCLRRAVCRGSGMVAQKKHGEEYVFVSRSGDPDAEIINSSNPPLFRSDSDTIYFPDTLPFYHVLRFGALGKAVDQVALARTSQWSALGDLCMLTSDKVVQPLHSINFDATKDTLYFPSLELFEMFIIWYDLTLEDKSIRSTGLTAVESLVIKGLIFPSTTLNLKNDGALGTYWFTGDVIVAFGPGISKIMIALIYCLSLKELILVDLHLEPCTTATTDSGGSLTDEERTRDFITKMTTFLKVYSQGGVGLQARALSEQIMKGGPVKNISEWLKEPVITHLSEEKLFQRFMIQ
ncbi:uncharacterized protein PAC_02450 [Phialocephala subalpina]|uniref:Uncharacterized protein n=1 Tax=Phialocephala subalpina TaxID=576137 RepID=A0A1L7WIG7_9HELO|nr:uncharacterized protein PAC_02450 [Phialocephala subalpina]